MGKKKTRRTQLGFSWPPNALPIWVYKTVPMETTFVRDCNVSIHGIRLAKRLGESSPTHALAVAAIQMPLHVCPVGGPGLRDAALLRQYDA